MRRLTIQLANQPELRRLIVFATVGTLNTAVCYALYAALVHLLAWHHNTALVADYAFGAALGFVAHRMATFADRKHVHHALGKYLATLSITFLANLVLLDGLVASGLTGPIAAQAVAMSLVTLLSYLLQKHWVFRSHQVARRHEAHEEAPARAQRRAA